MQNHSLILKNTKQDNILQYEIVYAPYGFNQYLIIVLNPLIKTTSEIEIDILAVIANVVIEQSNFTIMELNEKCFEDIEWIYQNNEGKIQKFDENSFMKENQNKQLYCIRFMIENIKNQQILLSKLRKVNQIIQIAKNYMQKQQISDIIEIIQTVKNLIEQ